MCFYCTADLFMFICKFLKFILMLKIQHDLPSVISHGLTSVIYLNCDYGLNLVLRLVSVWVLTGGWVLTSLPLEVWSLQHLCVFSYPWSFAWFYDLVAKLIGEPEILLLLLELSLLRYVYCLPNLTCPFGDKIKLRTKWVLGGSK